MSHVTFSVTQLKSALLCAAKSDIRYYLNGVYVESNGTTTRMCATTGHYLLAVDYQHGDSQDWIGNFIIPRDVCEMIAKVKNYNLGVIEIESEQNKVALNAAYRTVTGVIRVCDTCIGFKSVEGVFPQYTRVISPWIGNDTDMKPGQYNPEYIGTFSKVAKLLGSKLGYFTLWQRGNDSALVTFSSKPDRINAIGVLMPIRAESKDLHLPCTSQFSSLLPVETNETTQGEAFGA